MGKAIPLILDSTVYKQVPKLNSQLFKVLTQYTRISVFKLYIPEIIEKEYITWVRAEAQAAYDKVISATESLNKFRDESFILGAAFAFSITASTAHSDANGVLKKVMQNWNDFKIKTNAVGLSIAEQHGAQVMSSYFSGEIPFSKIKNRLDIPDAFIYQSLLDLTKNNENIVFISSDKNFIQKIKSEKITCFESLTQLFSSEQYKLNESFFAELDVNSRGSALIKFFEDDIHLKAKREIELSDLVRQLENSLIDEVIGEFVSISTEAAKLEIDAKNIKQISELAFLLPFSARLTHLISSVSTKDGLEMLDALKLSTFEKSVKDDGDFEISTTRFTAVQGNLSILFENTSPLTWVAKINGWTWLEAEFEEILISLEDIENLNIEF